MTQQPTTDGTSPATAIGPALSANPANPAANIGQLPLDSRVPTDPATTGRSGGDTAPAVEPPAGEPPAGEPPGGETSSTGARHRSGRSASGLRARLVVLVISVAVLVALVFTVAAVFLVRGKLTDVGAVVLADQANLVASGLPADPAARDAALESMSNELARHGIVVVPIGADGSLPASDRFAVRAARDAGARNAVNGASVSGTSSAGGDLRLVEARSTKAGGFALVTLAYDAVPLQDSLQRRLLAALLIGVVVAIAVGLIAARSLSASLRRAAALATSMSAGDLQVRIPIAGPREVAEVSVALNGMADALQRSEASGGGRPSPAAGGPAAQGDPIVAPASVPRAATAPLVDEFADGRLAQSDGLRPISHESDHSDGPNPALGGLVPITDEAVGAPGPEPRSFHLDLGPTDLRALVNQVGQAWRAPCDSAGVPLIVDVPADPVVVTSDTRRLRQVLEELAENALRVLEPGQPLVLHLGREVGPVDAGTPVDSGTPADAGTAVLQVRDGGPGLTREDFPVVFQQGVLRERYRGIRPGGAGLGLALVHRLVVQLGGTIVASPAPEGGVAITIRLPITTGGAP